LHLKNCKNAKIIAKKREKMAKIAQKLMQKRLEIGKICKKNGIDQEDLGEVGHFWKQKKRKLLFFSFFSLFTNVVKMQTAVKMQNCKNGCHARTKKERKKILFLFFVSGFLPTPPRSTWSTPFSTSCLRFGYNFCAFWQQFLCVLCNFYADYCTIFFPIFSMIFLRFFRQFFLQFFFNFFYNCSTIYVHFGYERGRLL
jgi:hypothetical protein